MEEENGMLEKGGRDSPLQFAVGNKVEVRCNGAAGLPPVWYEATVVRTLPRASRYTVEYGSRHAPVSVPSTGGNSARKQQQQQGMTQTVDLSDMRPLPPTPRAPRPGSTPSKSPGKRGRRPAFRVGDAVEAYHKEGWWAGCVAGEATGGTCRVKLLGCAGAEEKELEFLLNELRVRLDWIDGRWVTPPPPEEVTEQEEQVAGAEEAEPFKEGQLVEVSTDEDGFAGAWFLAVLMKRTASGKGFLIEYCDLKDDDGKDQLREEVDASHIRPLPPQRTDAAAGFEVLDEVDAWWNDAWWVGVVSKVLEGPRYAVYFRQSEEELEFASHEVRPHWDWIKGGWVRVALDSVGM